MKTLQHEPHPPWMMEIGSTKHQPKGIAVNPNLEVTFNMFFEHGYSATTADSRRIYVDAEQVCTIAKEIGVFGTHNFVFREN